MNKIAKYFFICVAFLAASFNPAPAQRSQEDPRNTLPTINGVPTDYEPNAAFPYGKLNPNAPLETAQFSFMIGEFDCVDQVVNPQTGKWVKFPAIWNAKYFLNGHGIQDQYWSPRFSTSNIRIFDRKEKKWKVTFFRMPGYSSGVWSGNKIGNDLVMRQGDDQKGSRLTFSKITQNRFEWVGESMNKGNASAFWKSSCKRRR